jgi:Ca2+-binding EF-hand superfamily protein
MKSLKPTTLRHAALLCGIAGLTVTPALAGPKAPDTAAVTAEFKKADANGDKKVSAAEHATCAKDMFATMDANQDGKVTAVEMEAAHSELSGGEKDRHHMSAEKKIKVVDSNGDGILTAEEHTAAAKSMFTKMDTDRDGFLTKDELAAGHDKMMREHTRSDS